MKYESGDGKKCGGGEEVLSIVLAPSDLGIRILNVSMLTTSLYVACNVADLSESNQS